MMEQSKELCAQYGVEFIPIKAEDVRYNIDIVYHNRTLLFAENMEAIRFTYVLQELHQILEKYKDGTFIYFFEKGKPKD